MRRAVPVICFVITLALAVTECGGSSSPSAPSPNGSSSAVTLSSLEPAAPSPQAAAQTVTFRGTGFQSGLSLAVTSPASATGVTVSGAAIQSVTDTSFTATIVIPTNGAYTFKVTTASGTASNTLSLTIAGRASSWTTEGTLLRKTDSSLADASALHLNDGRWRIFISYFGGIRSWISNDGVALTEEPGVRIATPAQCGHVRTFRVDASRIRIFCRSPQGITSATSLDEGTTWTLDGTLLISNAATSSAQLSTGGVVRTSDGRYRMYFSDDSSSIPPAAMKIFSATSPDLSTWTVEPGVRIGAGATASGTGTHPSAIVNPDGSVSVFYSRFGLTLSDTVSAVWVATSRDGLNFTNDVNTGLSPGADADVVQLSGSSYRVYYNWGDAVQGTFYSAVGSAPTAAVMAPQAIICTPSPATGAIR